MLRKLLLAAILVSISTARAWAGAYGTGSFENDDALNWADHCSRSVGTAVVVNALEGALSVRAKLYLEAPQASAAIAAAETIAAANGRPSPTLPPNLRTWVAKQRPADLLVLRSTARETLVRIARGSRSELRNLWSEGDGRLEAEWQRKVDDLLLRLAD